VFRHRGVPSGATTQDSAGAARLSRVLEQRGDVFRDHRGSDTRALDVLASRDAGEHEHRVPPQARPPLDVRVESVPDDERLAASPPSATGLEQRRERFAHDLGLGARRRRDDGQERAGTRPQAIGRRVRPVCVRRDQTRPALDQERRALERTTVPVETPYGPIDVKVARLNGQVVNEMPEFEQCRRAAKESGVPLKRVEEAVRVAWERQRTN